MLCVSVDRQFVGKGGGVLTKTLRYPKLCPTEKSKNCSDSYTCPLLASVESANSEIAAGHSMFPPRCRQNCGCEGFQTQACTREFYLPAHKKNYTVYTALQHLTTNACADRPAVSIVPQTYKVGSRNYPTSPAVSRNTTAYFARRGLPAKNSSCLVPWQHQCTRCCQYTR